MLIISTVNYLKRIQVVYQVKYRLFKAKPLKYYSLNGPVYYKPLTFLDVKKMDFSVKVKQETFFFRFLNLSKSFVGEVDWNFEGYGRLWNYNLQYMDWLNQNSLKIQQKDELAIDLYTYLWNGKLKMEPYPASLRIMNGIRYLSLHEGVDSRLRNFIKSEANFLTNRLEYHLLANHLLENAFAVYMAGVFFEETNWIKLGESLLRKELNEQILDDGAHFELSPMYHQIIFFRVLEFLAYESPESDLYAFVIQKAANMLSWLNIITFKNGQIPHFNDSINGIALSSAQLLDIAGRLGLKVDSNHVLKDSGFRKFENDIFELIIDVHGIAPPYQPGHAHADTFTFCLNYNEKPIIVDPGISTYNIGKRRDLERSTYFHNTINVNKQSSAEVWSGFRVGRRLNVDILKESPNLIEAIHNGYRIFKLNHKRKFEFSREKIEIIDHIEGDYADKKVNIQACLHFHPSVKLELIQGGEFLVDDCISLLISGFNKVYLVDYNYCLGYNKFEKAFKIIVILDKNANNLSTIFKTRE